MNCRPGDLAIVLAATVQGRVGGIVEVLRISDTRQGAWAVRWCGLEYDAYDKWLRPIRDSDGTDETLIYAGKPRELEQA